MANSTYAGRDAVHAVSIRVGSVTLGGDLVLPELPEGVVVFAHDGDETRTSPRSQRMAAHLALAAHAATLLVDWIGPDVPSSAEHLAGVHGWLAHDTRTAALPVAYFAAGTGAASALLAASRRRDVVAIVACGGRPDLVGKADLVRVEAPTLFIVGEHDEPVVDLNLGAQRQLRCQSAVEVVPGASHLFEEPGALDEVAHLASDWFLAFFHLRHEMRRRRDADATASGVRRKVSIGVDTGTGRSHRVSSRR